MANISPQSSVRELAEFMASLTFLFFGLQDTTPEDKSALAESILRHSVAWTNEHFDLGIPDG